MIGRILSIFLSLLIFLSPFYGCGKKAPPSYKTLKIARPVQALSYLIRPEGVILSWQYPYARDGIYFLIYRKGRNMEKVGETDKNIFIDSTPLSNGSREYVIVSSYNEGIKAEQRIIIETLPLPKAPSGFNFKIMNQEIILSWDKREGCLYNLYSIFSDNREELLNRKPLSLNFFKIYPDPEEIRTFRLRCLMGSVEGHYAEVIIKPEDYIPKKPEGLRYVIIDGTVVLTWKENLEKWIRGYRVYKDTGSGFVLADETTYPLFEDRLNGLKSIYYRITAIGPSKEGPYSDEIKVVQ
ncbi:MAG: hypothetical protein ACK4TF_08875 [Thermodesulfovibrionales bacterium]